MSDQLDTDHVYDPDTQKAFDLAVKFYEADKKLNRDDRQLLGSLYTKVTYSTLVFGWGTFFAVTSIPFYRQKLRTGSRKGTNVGRAILFGFAGMVIGAPIASKWSYNWQVDSLQETNPRCYEVAKILKPSEAVKWMMYYKLTADHPEHLMKDPRSLEASQQRNKKLMQNRDPMGLYSGPRFDMQQGPSKSQEQEKTEFEEAEVEGVSPENNSDGGANISSWDKIRLQNGMKTDGGNSNGGNSWNKVRQQSQPQQGSQPVNPFSTNVYKQPSFGIDNDGEIQEQSEFDKLLEKERHIGEEEEEKAKKRW